MCIRDSINAEYMGMLDRQHELKSEIRKMNKDRIVHNKQPFFYKKRTMREMLMVKEMDSMHDPNKLHQYMTKKKRAVDTKGLGIAQRLQDKKMRKSAKLAKNS
eukprot:TRINITY_DN30613_c0_g1_i1.p3 TRINITY_DN30613_c0_g1~~TRINITY_DN30613_c0_g1_i1.p3  ORF type:complete len:103 (+),score=27.91 TRINITY_DN30613_c0_g1_i1:168-476(+)